MSRLFDDASSEALNIDQAVVTAVPFTVSAWMRTNDLTPEQTVFFLGDSGAINNFLTLGMLDSANGNVIRFQARSGGAVNADTSTGASVNTWHHVCGVAAAANDRRVFIDGGSMGANGTNRTPLGVNRTSIGREGIPTPVMFFSGNIGHVAVWNVALTDDEVATLAEGISPLKVRRDSLIYYVPINGQSPELEMVGGLDMALIGTPTVAEEPPIPDSIVAPG